jgi:diguanylate cyclase (GGDEF)-like protein
LIHNGGEFTLAERTEPDSGKEISAHFAEAEGCVYCCHVEPALLLEIEQYLPPSYRLKPAASLKEIEESWRDLSRNAVLVRWDETNARNIEKLVRAIRNHCDLLPICLWCPETDRLPTHLLADGTVDHALRAEPATVISAVLANELLRSEQMGRLRKECHALADTSARDSLTQLFNHGAILRTLDNEFQRVARSRAALSCLMLDIDHFKAINDTYGHRFGDYILQELAQVVGLQVRATDIAGRYGGEEFLVVLPDTSHEGALLLGEKIRRAVENHAFRAMDIEALVTVSVGVASTSSGDVTSSEQLLQLSDRGLYFAKESGRNRVAAAHEHSSLSEYDVFRRQRRLADHSAPVLALCSGDAQLVRRLAQIAESDAYLLLVFDTPAEFFGAVEALDADVALMDYREEITGRDFVRQLNARMHTRHLAVGLLVNEAAERDKLPRGTDFVMERAMSDAALRETLRLALNDATLEREIVRLRQELRHNEKRLRRSERMATLGQIGGQLFDEIAASLRSLIGGGSPPPMPDAAGAGGGSVPEKLSLLAHRLRVLAAHNRQTDRKAVLLAPLLRHVIKGLDEPSAGQLGTFSTIAIENRVAEDFDIVVNAELFAHALSELIANALEAMPGGGKLGFAARRAGRTIEIELSDTGSGIREDVRSRIYEPFFTTHAERNARGLGVPIAASIIREQGGSLGFSPNDGGGTCATITLPAPAAEDDEPTLRWGRSR